MVFSMKETIQLLGIPIGDVVPGLLGEGGATQWASAGKLGRCWKNDFRG